MIDTDKLEAAMQYLAETDERCAAMKASVARTEYLAKVAEALAFKLATGNNEERKASARTEQTVLDAWSQHFDAITAYETVRARRERAVLTVDVWRSQNANRRQAA